MNRNNYIIKNYLPEIDSIRGFAILLVVLFHYDLMLDSGFLGVDIFFVLSGFLITKILEETKKRKDWILFFFNKRFRRIIPILYITIFCVMISSILIFSPVHLERISDSGLHAIFGISNIFFDSENGYFDYAKNFKPLLHTWSLSVELQLYLIWFFVYFFFLKNFKSYKYLIILCLIFSSLILSIIYSNRATFFFYFTGFRIYEFAFGALAYYLIKEKKNFFFGDVTFIISFVFIFLVSILFTDNSEFGTGNYNSFQSLSVVIPTFFILLSLKNLNIFKFFLRNSVLINFGKISYSLYLIHWPVLIFFFYSGKYENLIQYKIALLITSIFLSYVSYNYIENYFRKITDKKNFFIKNKILYSISFIYLLISTFIILNASELKPKNSDLDRYNQIINKDKQNSNILQKKYLNMSNKNVYFKENNHKTNILIIGDSHGWDVFYSLKKIKKINNDSTLQFYNMGLSTCFRNKIKENIFTKLIKKILTTYDRSEICKNILNDPNLLEALIKADKIIVVNRWYLNQDFIKIVNFFKLNTKTETIFINRINLFFDPPTLFYKNGIDTNKIAFKKKDEITYEINKKMNNLLSKLDIKYIDRSDFFCKNNKCTILHKNNLLFADQDHLTEAGHIYHSKLLKKSKLLSYLFD